MREKECVLRVCVITLNAHNKGLVFSEVWMVCVCVVCISLSLSLSLSLCFLCVSVSPSGALWMCRSLVLFSDECLSSFFSLSRVEIRKCNVSVYLCLSYAGV